MPNTFSIENINLNGSILTARDGRLYINEEQVKNTSGIQLTERYFIKGYSPVSFYSRWATIGNYLNETYFNDFFMVTGMLISCAVPATGTVTLAGRFYSRNPNSVVETETISFFNLPTRTVYQSQPLHYKLNPNRILGLDIYQAPNELKSISLNLLGYSPAAGHFDKMPSSITFYERSFVQTGFEFEEKFNQYDGAYTGIKIMSKVSGFQTIDSENISGYVSGILKNNPKYFLMSGTNISGYIIDGSRYFFNTGSQFNQFNNIPQFFNPVSGYLWNGFQFTGDQNYFFSGFNGNKYGSGELIEPIGQRTIPIQELVTGFLSGYKPSGQAFIPLNQISGFSGDPRIGNLPLTSGLSGYLIGGSGFYIGDSKYFFKTGSSFSGFQQFPSIFTQELGYQYYPIGTNPDYLFTNYFSGIFPDGSGGFTGQLIGYIGYRYQPSGQIVSGFARVKSDFDFTPLQINSTGQVSGISGYYMSGSPIRFLTGNNFSGFNGLSGFDNSLGYKFDGFNENTFTEFQGIGVSVIVQKPITGFVSGYLNEFNQFSMFTGNNAGSGYIISGLRYYFSSPFSGITSGMFGFTDGLGFSYIVDQNTFQYDNTNFISDMSGISFGSGIITGNIGYKNAIEKDTSFGTGIMFANIGYRNVFNFSPLSGNFYYRNDDGSRINGPFFKLNIGEISEKIDLSNSVFKVPADKFIGIDINKTLSGIYGLSIALFGYYE